MIFSKNKVNAKQVYTKYGLSGKGVRIALLDTGVYPRNELVDKVIFFKDYVNGKSQMYDDNGHGTHIAGIVCGGKSENGMSGMAEQAELIVLKVLDKKGAGKTCDVLNALSWVLQNKERYNIRLLNFSIGYTINSQKSEQEKMLRSIEKLWDAGIGVVVAAGNNGPKRNSVTVPGVSEKVITVGAMGENNFSGIGPTDNCVVKPEILAPGTHIIGLKNAALGYSIRNGTSMATPIVCGALALALEMNKNLSVLDMKMSLYKSVRKIPDYNYCWGILDVDRLVQCL